MFFIWSRFIHLSLLNSVVIVVVALLATSSDSSFALTTRPRPVASNYRDKRLLLASSRSSRRRRSVQLQLQSNKNDNDDDPGFSSSSPVLKNLYRWAEKEEIEGLEMTYISTITTDDFNNRDHDIDESPGQRQQLGLFAEEDIDAGEYICAVPFTASLLVDDSSSSTSSTSSENNDSDIDPDVRIGCNFLNKFVLADEEGRWGAYLEGLPKPTSSSSDSGRLDPTADMWKETEIEQLQIPRLVKESIRRKRSVAELASIAASDDDDASVKDRINTLQWATWIVRSRGFTTLKLCATEEEEEDSDGSSSSSSSPPGIISRTVLLPIFDMLNHNADPNASIEVLEIPDAYDESFYTLQAITPIRVGEEITISYGTGHETSIDLFSKYGFWTSDNPADENINWDAVDAQWTTKQEEDMRLLSETEDPVLQKILNLRIHLKHLQQQQQK